MAKQSRAIETSLDPTVKPTCTIDECAALLGVARSSAYAAARAGDLPVIQIGRRLLVPTAALIKMLGLEDQGSVRRSDES
jgi:excisionase family DNA binding protein